MKKLALQLFTILIIALTFTACNKDDDTIPEKEGNCMEAKINGEDFSAETTTGVYTESTIQLDNGDQFETKNLVINGTIPSLTGDTKLLTLSFSCAELTNTLDTDTADPACGIGLNYTVTSFIDPANSIAVQAIDGVVIIEEYTDDHIRGTFSFTGMGSDEEDYTFTEGLFDTDIIQ